MARIGLVLIEHRSGRRQLANLLENVPFCKGFCGFKRKINIWIND